METDELSFDTMAERGQYRAFQRAYGKENQAMLGLILLTVAWSYAAHVYGHASVFSWFMRYLMTGIGIFTLYHMLLYAHNTFERAVGHYRNWEREQNEALRGVRVREKARERRKRARVGDSQIEGDFSNQVSDREQREEEEARNAAKLEAEMKEAKARKKAAELEEQEARKEVQRRKKAQEAAAAAVKQTKKQAQPQVQAQPEPQPQAQPKAQAQAQPKAQAQAQAQTQAQAQPQQTKSKKKSKGANKVVEPANLLSEESQQFISQFMHPDQVSDDASQNLPLPAEGPTSSTTMSIPVEGTEDVPAPLDREDLKRAEHAVAFAKQEAERAHRQLLMAEEAAKLARAQTKGPVGSQQSPPANKAPGSNKGDKRNSMDKRDSFKGLRPNQTGSGYVPPHLRDGYTPKPTKMLPPAYDGGARQERSNSNASRKKPYPAPNRPMNRSPGLSPTDAIAGGGVTPTSSAGASPGSLQSSPEAGQETVRVSTKKQNEPVFESKNAFAMLEEDDN